MKALSSIAALLLVGTIAWADASDLARAQAAAAKKAYELNLQRIQSGVGAPKVLGLDFEKTCFWSKHWLKAELVLIEKKSDRVKAHEAHLERMKSMESLLQKFTKAAAFSANAELAAVEYYRLEAEIMLNKAKGK